MKLILVCNDVKQLDTTANGRSAGPAFNAGLNDLKLAIGTADKPGTFSISVELTQEDIDSASAAREAVKKAASIPGARRATQTQAEAAALAAAASHTK